MHTTPNGSLPRQFGPHREVQIGPPTRVIDLRTIAVEKWLRKLELARGSKAMIRSIMSVLFNHAIQVVISQPLEKL